MDNLAAGYDNGATQLSCLGNLNHGPMSRGRKRDNKMSARQTFCVLTVLDPVRGMGEAGKCFVA